IDDLQKTLIADQWNAIGNPFTTYYPANKNSNSSFLNDNMNVLDDAFKSLYVWDNAQGKYVAITEVDIAARSLPPGQGFFIKMKTGETEINFNKEKRSTKPTSGTSTFEKSTSTPTITLKVTNETKTVTTDIKYFENATFGLDPGFDIGNFNSSSLDIYTRLLDENISTNFTIQSLPLNSYESAIIPIGLHGNNGDRITFTIASINIPNSINIYLEDKEKNTYQKLSETNGNYTIVLKDKFNGVDRFYLHTNSKSLGTKQISTLEDVSIFNTNKILKINGLKNDTTNIKHYSILGKEVFNKNFTANKKNEILLPKISKGVYLVKLITVEGTLNKKIIID
ncbi:MAG: T9SS type A sorting domain-containing protein, partial [Flavobacteriales bacterium]